MRHHSISLGAERCGKLGRDTDLAGEKALSRGGSFFSRHARQELKERMNDAPAKHRGIAGRRL
jgi:hypothetical protein